MIQGTTPTDSLFSMAKSCYHFFRFPSAVAFLTLVSPCALAQDSTYVPMTMREISLLAGALVALMTFMSGQVLIPYI
ncbi:hypothetical protein [Hahella ganghwensis]|uniref:hypothetical protein n=1 Tax=Hahella ganghwensis TaxID=286420 RepID=UPI00036F23E6|nr:hypothetical protein [Hahella ganghwensis]